MKNKEAKSEAQAAKQDINPVTKLPENRLHVVLDHYSYGTEDMEARKNLKNEGWNAIFKAYLGVLPDNWPYQTRVTDPRIKTAINEKTARLLNGKLRGHLNPREGGDSVGARIHNALLEGQWDAANLGGTMLEKVAKTDTMTRLIGGGYHYNYWDSEKNSNESKVCDPRDLMFSGDGDHLHNSTWVQYREFITVTELKARGYDVKDIEFGNAQTRESKYDSIVKEHRSLQDRLGRDKANPVVEMITEWQPKWATEDGQGRRTVFLPHYQHILEDGPNPYKHGKVPFSQLRYYAIHDDIYGESEVVPVLPLQRAINAILCGYLDEMNLAMRPPVKVVSGAVRLDTIVYGPGAYWVVNRLDAVDEVNIGGGSVQAFNNTYPALVAALNNAMGDQSMGIANTAGQGFTDKTATEVNSNDRQQITRDQFNQLFLAEFLKDIMMQWLVNNQQFLFDDETKHVHILKIVGKDKIEDLKQMALDQMELSGDTAQELALHIKNNPGMGREQYDMMMKEAQMPKNAVIMNPDEEDPDALDIQPKLNVINDNEADLAITPDDAFMGGYDYIADVKSMAAGATKEQQESRKLALEAAKDPNMTQQLQQEGVTMKVSELLVKVLEDAGYKDAQSLFEKINYAQVQQGAGVLGGGAGIDGAGAGLAGPGGNAGLPAVPQAVPGPTGANSVPGPVPIQN